MSKEETVTSKNTRALLGKAAGILVLLLSPGAMYVIFENITGDIGNIPFLYAALNMAAYYIFYFLLFALAGSTRVVYPLLNAALTVLALAEYFVVSFRSRPIMLGDLMAVRTAATVSGGYSYEFTPKLIALILISVFFSVCAIAFSFKIKRLKVRIGALLGMILLTAGSGAWFYKAGIRQAGIDINMWDPLFSYQENGYILSTLYAFSFIDINPPEGYSTSAVADIDERIREDYREEYESRGYLWKDETSDMVPENIICIMNESFSDLSVVGSFETDVPYLENYNSLEENCLKGHLYMPVHGAMTCNSEYEFLTGNAMSFCPPGSVPYQVYMNQTVYGLPLTLKDQGYHTVAMHPYPGYNWNRNQAFEAMGFDEFLDEDDFETMDTIRGYCSDRSNYDKIISVTEEKEKGEPLFIFNVTMQNHGGYVNEEYESQVHLTQLADMPQTEQYLSLIRESDEALGYLLDYYKEVEEPTMIIMFGDHQPAVETEFYEALYGKKMEDISEEENIRRFITPFLVWTNYHTESGYVDKMSAAYLSNVIVERANLEPTDYQIFMDKMYEQTPVIHPLGYYDGDGVWSDWDGWKEDGENYPMFKDYYILHYNNMFGGKKKNTDVFAVHPQS
ncbi:MAG TPA: sulfatase-like hydrolase/transferase [Candidatus Lachnoclostridium stercoravium]|uniref:Sulfatase-like hydrolase/transferase n=1 Tax=Candidatus Lachnoclostridium stercoravium TaxID=2838633 RepID=A0A9D2HKU9_9FIRM|nr:sulfatase-like hydrolase/transferase [Candidatus Lachnoclostridium stercoravium]